MTAIGTAFSVFKFQRCTFLAALKMLVKMTLDILSAIKKLLKASSKVQK
jgi:hypothetical protein